MIKMHNFVLHEIEYKICCNGCQKYYDIRLNSFKITHYLEIKKNVMNPTGHVF